MSYGLQVFNDSGTVQIDENYRNLVCTQSISFTSAGDHWWNLTGLTSPVLVLYSSDPNGIVLQESNNPSAGAFNYRINGVGEAYIFDVCPPAGAHGAGLQVFNASGQLVFDSSYSQLVICDQLQTRCHFDRIWYPTQTISTQHQIFYNSTGISDIGTVEPAAAGGPGVAPRTLTPYAKPSGKKWGWIVTGTYMTWFWDDPYYNDYGHPNENKGCFKSLPAPFASGDNFKFKMRDLGQAQGGEYAPPYSTSGTSWFIFVDLTNVQVAGSSGAALTTFNPAAATYNVTDGGTGTAQYTITASAPVVWTWGASNGGSANVVNGGTASSITFTLNGGSAGANSTITCSANGQTWTLNMSASAVSSGGGGGTVTYSPVPGNYGDDEIGTASYTLYASAPVVWTYTKQSGVAGTVTDENGAAFTSGGTAMSLTFMVSGTASITKSQTFNVASGGNAWTVNLTGEATSGGTCVTVDSFVLMANGRAKRAGDLQIGDLVWTQHEHTRKWGAHRITALLFDDDVVYDIPGHPLATKRHRFALPFKGWWRAGWIGRKVGVQTVAKITVADAHTYMAKRRGGKWKLSHNIKSN